MVGEDDYVLRLGKNLDRINRGLFKVLSLGLDQWRTEGGLGGSTPPPEIPKALQNRAKLNPSVKTVKNC